MAQLKSDQRRVIVEVTQAEISALIVQPAKNAGFIDFDPTRINVAQNTNGTFTITFEKVGP